MVQPQEVEDKPELTTYEEFLREARAIDQQQRLLNQRCASLTTYTLRGTTCSISLTQPLSTLTNTQVHVAGICHLLLLF